MKCEDGTSLKDRSGTACASCGNEKIREQWGDLNVRRINHIQGEDCTVAWHR